MRSHMGASGGDAARSAETRTSGLLFAFSPDCGLELVFADLVFPAAGALGSHLASTGFHDPFWSAQACALRAP